MQMNKQYRPAQKFGVDRGIDGIPSTKTVNVDAAALQVRQVVEVLGSRHVLERIGAVAEGFDEHRQGDAVACLHVPNLLSRKSLDF